MRRIAIAFATISLLGACSTVAASQRKSGEEELAKLLEGREAGKPTSCISTFDNRELRIIDKTALVYGSGETIYVNRPRDPERLDSNDILVTYPTGSQLCRLDRVNTIDRTSRMYTGFVAMTDWVPYRRVAKAN